MKATCCKCQTLINGHSERYSYKDPADTRRICDECFKALLGGVLTLCQQKTGTPSH